MAKYFSDVTVLLVSLFRLLGFVPEPRAKKVRPMPVAPTKPEPVVTSAPEPIAAPPVVITAPEEAPAVAPPTRQEEAIKAEETADTVQVTRSPALPKIINLPPRKPTVEKLQEWSSHLAKAADHLFKSDPRREDAFEAHKCLKLAWKVIFKSWDYPAIEKAIVGASLPDVLVEVLARYDLDGILEVAEEANEEEKAWTLINGLTARLKRELDSLFKETNGKRAKKPMVNCQPKKADPWALGCQFTEALRLGNIGAAQSALRQIEKLGGERQDLRGRIVEASANIRQKKSKNSQKRQRV